jgi:hypothetical protein
MNRCILVTLLAFAIHAAPLFGRTDTLHVSPDGNDSWTGRLPAPAEDKTDGPLRTLEGARDAARNISQAQSAGLDEILILVHDGTYRLKKSLRITQPDIPPVGQLVWKGFPGSSPRITGSVPVTGFAPPTRPEVLRRLAPSARASVLCADIRSQGVADFGSIEPRGNPGLEFFYNGKRMDLARYPNEGWLTIADVPQSGDTMYNKGLEREKRFDGVPVGRHYGRITYAGDRPATWAPAKDIIVHGYWTWDWSDTYQKVQSINTARHELTIAQPHHNYGYTKNQRFRFLNVLEELDMPGEWYLDREAGILYFIPPQPIRDASAEVSILEDPLIALDECTGVTFEGFRFDCTRGPAVIMNGGSHNTLARCAFRNGGSDAIVIKGGMQHTVNSCEISDMARGAILASGGDRRTLTPSHHLITNTHIHHYGAWLRTGAYAAILEGVGQQLSHCSIHDAPFEAIGMRGNDHVMEYNEIYGTMKESGDAGAMHTGRDWTWRGNVIRYNYFHDLKGPGLHGVMGVYLDDWASGFTVFGNVFYRAGRATMVGGGRDNVVQNNVYVECSPSLHLDARGKGWASYYFDTSNTYLFDRFHEVHGGEPPYTTRYPELALLPGPTPDLPVNNRIINNLSYGGRWLDIYDYQTFSLNILTLRQNVSADTVILRRWIPGQKGWDPYYLNIDLVEGYDALRRGDPVLDTVLPGNTFTNVKPFLFDPEHRKIVVPPDSPVWKTGFREIPFAEMGLLHN